MALSQKFVSLEKSHHVKIFDCGKDALNIFLHRYALKNSALGISKTWVLTMKDGNSIVAYFTLSSSTVYKDEVPLKRSHPPYALPVVLLARLAVDNQYKGQHIGEKTLVSALRQAIKVADQGLPAIGLILDVLDKEALSFYQKYDIFEPFNGNENRLFVPMNTIRSI